MRHIVLDLEWNQPRTPRDTLPCGEQRRMEGDIIQIGAVLLDESFQILAQTRILVKPDFYTKMNKRVSEITGITDEMLRTGIPLRQALPVLIRMKEENDAAFYSWGLDDLRIMRQNCFMYDMEDTWLTPWYNLQMIYGLQNGAERTQKALSTALEVLGLSSELPAHDALNDALFAAMVMQKLDMEKGLAEYPSEGKRKKKKPVNRHRAGRNRRPRAEAPRAKVRRTAESQPSPQA